MITIDKALLNPDGAPPPSVLEAVRKVHGQTVKEMVVLKDMYDGRHEILSRTRLRGLPNNRLPHDLPGYIVTMAAGYLVGEPVSYAAQGAEQGFTVLQEALKAAMTDNVDAELAVDAALFGKAVEICYADEGSRPRAAQISPLNAFVVYDDTVEHLPMFGVSVCEVLDGELKPRAERVVVYTAAEQIMFESKSLGGPLSEVGRARHYFGGVPLTEYWNNSRERGDFQSVMDLINAYDALQSDRVNDKQQFTDSILALYGVGGLGVQDTEEYDPAAQDEEIQPEHKSGLTPSQRLRQTKTLFMPGDGAKAEFLTKPAAEGDADILRKSLKSDIHKLSMVPDLTDENFAGNLSGVAMRFKLLGLEQLTRIKERWFREGLRSRLRLFAAFLAMRGAAEVDVDQIEITFKRALPVNESEIAAMVANLDGLVPREILLAQVPFVQDPKAAMLLLQQEQKQDRPVRE